MGIESLVYRFEANEFETGGLADYLRSRGAVEGDREGTYVLSTNDYWIDVLLSSQGEDARRLLMRVALTNPMTVVPAMDELMDGLVARWGGRITDASGNRVIPDVDRIATLTNDFRAGREQFTRPLGDVTWPVSADEVFPRLRSLDEGAP